MYQVYNMLHFCEGEISVTRPTRRFVALQGGLMLLLTSLGADAINKEWDNGIRLRLNTMLTAGAAIRLEERDPRLLGKANINPQVCANQSCQGTSQPDTAPNDDRIPAPGAYSTNNDAGNWNYARFDLTQAVLKLNQDLSLQYEDVGFFGRLYAFYDVVNQDFTTYHPNLITADTVPDGPPALLPVGAATYGSGDAVRRQRTDKEILRQVGADIQVLDAYAWTFLPLPGDRELSLKLGRQSLNWGESTVAVINSLNQINPPDLNRMNRVGSDLSETFTPVGLAYAATGLSDNIGLEIFYQYEWQPLIIPAPGSFMAFVDIGSRNAVDHASIGLGTAADVDEPGLGAPLNNPLSGLTDTSTRIERLPDNNPPHGGQFGASLNYYADWLGDGTSLSLYAMRYHSRLPYVSFYAADASCARREGNALGIDANDAVSLGLTCPDLPLLHPDDPHAATSDAVPLDTVRFQMEYPRAIELYGFSFNSTIDPIAIQGEVAFRPHLPVQLDIQDLNFAANGPLLSRCHDPAIGCAGTATSGPGTFSLGAPIGGDAPGSARAFPSFVMPYRGVASGETPPNSYIRGWERFAAWQFNLGATYVAKPALMDQLLVLAEVAATWVPDMPDPCTLPLEGPGTFLHPSRGADGTGSPGFAGRACDPPGLIPPVDGPDGLRFNPSQQVEGFPTPFSWGYRLVLLPRWESILPGISIQGLLIWSHDIAGIAPGPGENFLEGRHSLTSNFELRYKDRWGFNLGYASFGGAGGRNLLRDRDQLSAYVRYSF